MHHYKNILITGGAGFIGSHYINYLLKKNAGIKIINLDLLTYAADTTNIIDDKNNTFYKFIHGDICSNETVSSIMEEYDIDTIVHFAAESHVDNSILSPSNFVDTNIIGTYTLLESARKFWQERRKSNKDSKVIEGTRFHHVSTDEVYGSLDMQDPSFKEQSPYRPNSPYSSTKAASDHLVRAWGQTYKMPISISNCSNNFGENQDLSKLIPKVINCCINRNPIPIYGNGLNIRDWLYVEDHCRAIDSIIMQGKVGDTWNIGGDNEISNIKLVSLICGIFDTIFRTKKPYSDLIYYIDDRQGHDFRYAVNSDKIKNKLNWKPSNNFESLLRKVIMAYIAKLN